ncbi:MAG: alpha amylase [Candidatus Falkowbacteria bacterium GW2011_GWC2_38_22]|nr:MAG: alpha amylase [Candidatus Falkowbacteria bacterium GW2011_GWC2_38_22]
MIFFLSGFFYCLIGVASGLVNINTAGLEELDSLPGIGASKAAAIIEYRTLNGNFQRKEDIMSVSGIGQATYDGLKDLIMVLGDDAPAETPEIEICGNRMIEGLEECDDGNTAGGDGCNSICKLEAKAEEVEDESATQSTSTPIVASREYHLGDIVINEFVSDPADDDVEWIELYNNTNLAVDLSGWTIEDGGGAKTMLTGTIGNSGTNRYFIMEKPKGSLNNSGDLIVLRFQGKLIDSVAYGKWNGGMNNAEVAEDPFSIARKIDGYNTFVNSNDFSLTVKPTKKGANTIVLKDLAEDEVSASDRANYDYSESIIISEIFSNPAGDDTKEEFIELYNDSERDVDLSEWRLGDESSRKYTITKNKDDAAFSTIIKAKGYWAIKRPLTKIALNNSSDAVFLYQPFLDKALDAVRYEKTFENQSYNHIGKNSYAWSETVTYGKTNVIKTVNHAPLVSFDFPTEVDSGKPVLFDSSDTADEDGDQLSFFWDFGDGATNTLAIAEHTYFREGAFTVSLKVDDGKTEAKKEKIIKISKLQQETINRQQVASGDWDIIINEIMPNPLGDDGEEEWIELYNNGGTVINMLDWSIDDMEGGSKPYIFKNEFLLEAGKYFLLERLESKLALNNSDDAVRLFSPNGEIVDEVSYAKTAEGEAYARGANDKWFWTTVPTPEEENIIKTGDSKMTAEIAGVVVKGASLKYSKEKALTDFASTTLEKLKEMEVGDKVRVSGTVAVLPGILGAQYFYIVGLPAGQAGSPGIQVYSYKKDFPKFKIGDYVEVKGEIAESGGERRIKTALAEDMRIIEHQDAPVPLVETCDRIEEEHVGRLVSVTGDIVDRKSATVFLDDGTGEIKAYIKNTTGIVLADIKEGEKLQLTGIVGQTSAGIRLLPRGPEDVVKQNTDVSGESVVLGEVASSDNWELAARDKKLEMFKYLLVGCLGFLAVMGGALYKLKRG